MECQVCGDKIEDGDYVSGQGFWACSIECVRKIDSQQSFLCEKLGVVRFVQKVGSVQKPELCSRSPVQEHFFEQSRCSRKV